MARRSLLPQQHSGLLLQDATRDDCSDHDGYMQEYIQHQLLMCIPTPLRVMRRTICDRHMAKMTGSDESCSVSHTTDTR